MTRKLLIVAHAPSPNTRRLAESALAGARSAAIEDVEATWIPPLEAGPADVLACDAILLGTTENLGYMAGAMKDFFDRTFYAVLDKTDALPCALYIRAGHDGTGTRRAIESIVGGLKWKWVQEPLTCRGKWQEAFADQVAELGEFMAAGLDNDLF